MAPYRLPDGTPAFHGLAELPQSPGGERVLCGLCGRWFRALSPHLRQKHGWTAEDYRAAFGLNATRPLQARSVSERQAAALARRMRSDRRVIEGMRKGLLLARAGELNRMGRESDIERGRAIERKRSTREQGRRLGLGRAARFRAGRDGRARALGYSDAAVMLRERYRQGATVRELAAALGCAEITVTGEMDRLGIRRRTRAEHVAVLREPQDG